MKLYYWENETDGWVEVAGLSVDNLMNRLANHNYTFLLRVTDPIVIDNLQISTLTAEGVANNPGDVLNRNFDSDIKVAVDDVAGDYKGFDSEDDLNDFLNFGW